MGAHTADRVEDRTLLLQIRLEGIARNWPAVTFHPEDPNRADIEAVAARLGLAAVPDEAVRFRTVRGCPTPAPAPDAPEPAVEALTGAVVATLASPLAYTTSPVDPDRNRVYARLLHAHLVAAGWTLTRAGAA